MKIHKTNHARLSNIRGHQGVFLIFLSLMFLLSFSFAYAGEVTIVNTTYRITADSFNQPDFQSVYNVSLFIVYPNGTPYLSNINMTPFGVGRYYYDFVPTQLGNYYTYARYWNETTNLYTESDTINVIDSFEALLIAYFGTQAMFDNFLIIAVFLGLYAIGYFTKSWAVMIAGGLFAFGASPVFDLFTATGLNYTFMILLGLLAVFHGAWSFEETRKDRVIGGRL